MHSLETTAGSPGTTRDVRCESWQETRDRSRGGPVPRRATVRRRRRDDGARQFSRLGPPTPCAEASPRDDLAVAFLVAAADLDTPALSEILDAAWECYGADDVADDWLLPTLELLGQATGDAVLHAVGAALARDLVRGRLMTAYDDALRGVAEDAGRVLVGAAAGAGPDLEALAFAGVLARAGVAATYLGATVPDAGWEAAVRASASGHVVLVTPGAEGTAPTVRLADRLLAASPAVTVHIGGREQDQAPASMRRLGSHLGMAADALALDIAFDRLPPR